jgi:hypothetical protein
MDISNNAMVSTDPIPIFMTCSTPGTGNPAGLIYGFYGVKSNFGKESIVLQGGISTVTAAEW